MRYTQSYLLALPNKTTDVIIVFLLCRVGPTTLPTTTGYFSWRNLPCVGSRISWSYDVCSPFPTLFPLLASYVSYVAFLECGILVRDCTIAKIFFQSNTITVELLCFDQWGSRSTRCSLSVGLWALEMFAVSCMENCRRNIHACCWILRNGRWCVHGFTQRRWAVGFSTSRWKRFRQSACHFQGKDIDIACSAVYRFRQVASWVSLFCS